MSELAQEGVNPCRTRRKGKNTRNSDLPLSHSNHFATTQDTLQCRHTHSTAARDTGTHRLKLYLSCLSNRNFGSENHGERALGALCTSSLLSFLTRMARYQINTFLLRISIAGTPPQENCIHNHQFGILYLPQYPKRLFFLWMLSELLGGLLWCGIAWTHKKYGDGCTGALLVQQQQRIGP